MATHIKAKNSQVISRPGISFVELMVAVALISICIIGLFGSFSSIQRAVQGSKNRTLASNLAQEKMQILKQKSYYQVLVTSNPAYNADFTPNIPYDPGYFPPENITEAGVTYSRLTYIQVAREDSGAIVELPAETPDTGMRLITITVTWDQAGVKKELQIRSLLSNPDTVMANAVFNGTVKTTAAVAIDGALVNAAENMGWRDTTNASGVYSINLSPGNFTLVVSAPGYYSAFRTVSIAANAMQTQDFNLVKIAVGSVTGTVWKSDRLLISQVVASTGMVGGAEAEYVELFNPTTSPINIGSSADGNVVKVKYLGETATDNVGEFKLSYISTWVAPGKFYLMGNTTLKIAGSSPILDAVIAGSNPSSPQQCAFGGGSTWDCIRAGKAGAIIISDSSGNILDKVGWSNTSAFANAPGYEGAPIISPNGLAAQKQIVRMSGPGSLTSNYGRAYDSGTNSLDFYLLDMNYPPYGTNSGAKTIISGAPANGAVVTASDGLSASTGAWLSGIPPSAVFTLVDVATGTWAVIISSGSFMLENDIVTIAAAGSVYNFPSSTTLLNQNVTQGLINGRVLNSLGVPISAPSPITLSPGGAGSDATANTSNGGYTLRVNSGFVDVTANPNNANPSYVSISSLTIPMELGEVHSGVDFILYQGARISGFVTRDGINPLPGVAVAIIDSNDSARDVQVTGLDGRFVSINVSTGDYIVEPMLSSHELSTPSTTTVSLVTAGTTQVSPTFTVSGAMGYITGTVKSGGQPIKTGVLIVVTTTTLTGTPPAPPDLSGTGPPYYLVSSMETGVYTAEAPQATYNVYAYYSTPAGAFSTIVSSKAANVPVTAGQTTTGINFSW